MIAGWIRRHRIAVEWLLLAVLLVAATAVCAQQRWLWRIDLVLYDSSLALWERPAPDDVVIVAIDDLSIAEIGRWPWRRAVHATLLDRLAAAGARAVALDLIVTDPDLRDPQSDAALAKAIGANGKVVLPVVLEAAPDGTLSETQPLPAFAAQAAALGHIGIGLDGDGIARSVYLEEGLGHARWPHLSVALLGVAEPARASVLPGTRNTRPAPRPDVWVRDRWMHIPFGGAPGHFRQVSYVNVLRGEVPVETLRDRLVLVGMTATGAGDAYPTPRASEGRPMPGVEIVAHVLDGLRAGVGLSVLHGWLHSALSAAAVAALLVAYLWLRPSQSLAATGIALVAVSAVAALAIRYLHVWVAPSAMLAGLVLCYPLWSWRRLEATQRYFTEELARLQAEPGVLEQPAAPTAARAFAIDRLDSRLQAVRAATERLRNLRQFLTDVGMSLPDALVVADNAGRVLTANARAAEFLGATSVGALNGQPVANLLAGLRLAGERSWGEVSAAAPTSVEASDAAGRDLLLNVVPCATHEGRRIGLIVRLADITPLKAAEREREEVLRFLSHDMRSPQASILMLVAHQRDLVGAAGADAAGQAEALAQIERYARRTLALADDFVQLARAQALDAGELGPVDVAAVARDAADEAWPQARAKEIRIEREIDVAEAWVRGDRQLLARALGNLLSNAIKYSPARSGVRLAVARGDGGVACAVIDKGEGIAPEALPRLFEPFQRFAAERHPESDGSGLGLAFVKAVADKHAGRVTVSSGPGVGSRFTLWIPGAE